MDSFERLLRQPAWNLARARSIAELILNDKVQVRSLVRELFSEDVDVRKRAADVARRITERNVILLQVYMDEIAGLLETLSPSESRTRWHLGLVVPRIAHNRAQFLRAARIMLLLAEDESNVVRCSAVEGLGLLALQEESLLGDAEAMIHSYLRIGTPAMKSRARHVERLLARRRI